MIIRTVVNNKGKNCAIDFCAVEILTVKTEGATHAKKKQHEKSCEIKGGGPEVAVVV